MTAVEKPKRVAGPRLQHVVAHVTAGADNPPRVFDEVVVFGQEIDALRSILGKPNWIYAAVTHGQKLTDALNNTTTTEGVTP